MFKQAKLTFMIDFSINKEIRQRNIDLARAKGIRIPTIAQMRNPELIPEDIRERLTKVALQDTNPLNLYRISWKNEAKETGGLFRSFPNYVELPPILTGVPCRIVGIAGKWFPTGCHKVGASFGCLAPRLVTGQFDASTQKAVWPSTGNFCRGGAFISKLLGVSSIAIIPEDMSRERFQWMQSIGAEIIKTASGDENIKFILDKVKELKQKPENKIFNQFEEMGNVLWHYNVTGNALSDLYQAIRRPGDRLAGACFLSGSGGTMSSGDRLKDLYPTMKLAVGEAQQSPTILNNGYGNHRIEGIGDKLIPWVHNVKNSDMAIAINDEDSQRLLRLFNTPEGKTYLKEELKLEDEFIEQLCWLGISGIANVLCCIKMAKYFEFNQNDILVTVFTDSSVMYKSRIQELTDRFGAYSSREAWMDHHLHMLNIKTDNLRELTYPDRRRIHNLKYFTWVEQQDKTLKQLENLWYDREHTWDIVHNQADELDTLIEEFNASL